jgi:hypothetical protein
MGLPAFCAVPPPVGVGLPHSLWFRKVLPYLVAEPFFGGVIALMGPHATTVRLGPKAIGQTLSGLITPCGGGAEFRPSLSKGV